MDSLTQIKANILKLLKANTGLNDVEIVEEFVGANKLPTDKPILTVGIDSVELVPAGLGGYFGENCNKVHQGAWGKITLRFDCYTDQVNAMHSNHLIFERLCTLLIGSELGITRVYSAPISPSKSLYDAKLVIKAELQAVVSSTVPKQLVSDFVLKRSAFDE